MTRLSRFFAIAATALLVACSDNNNVPAFVVVATRDQQCCRPTDGEHGGGTARHSRIT